ncbi:MAG: hypothetical protein GY953_01890, partial [bacterium]|nr:hypothetical protein [bacterium]
MGANVSDEARAALRQRFDAYLAVGLAQKAIADERKIYVNAAGFARTDALTRIGN